MSPPALPAPDTGPPLPEPETSPCERCDGMCCSFTSMDICLTVTDDLDAALDLEERVRATVRREPEGNLLRKSGDPVNMRWYTDGYYLWFDCQHLTDDGLCGIYEDRPDLCRTFKCAVLRGEQTLSDYKDAHEMDRTVEDLGDDATEVTDIVTDEIRRMAAE